MSNELIHYGVLGMKWGRRKSRTSGSSDGKIKRKLSKKQLRKMSNADLKALNSRLQLEKSYKELKKSDISSGKKWAIGILAVAGTQIATQYVSKGLSKGVEGAFKLATIDKDALSYLLKK